MLLTKVAGVETLWSIWGGRRLNKNLFANVLERILQRKPCAHTIPKGIWGGCITWNWSDPAPVDAYYTITYHTTTQHHMYIRITIQHNNLHLNLVQMHMKAPPPCQADLICKIFCRGISWPTSVSPELCSSRINDVTLRKGFGVHCYKIGFTFNFRVLLTSLSLSSPEKLSMEAFW